MCTYSPESQLHHGLHQEKCGQQVEGIDSLLQYCVQISALQGSNGMNLSEQVQRMASKIIKILEHLSCEDRLKEIVLLSLGKRKLWGDIIVAFQYLRRAYRKDVGDSL